MYSYQVGIGQTLQVTVERQHSLEERFSFLLGYGLHLIQPGDCDNAVVYVYDLVGHLCRCVGQVSVGVG